MTFCTSEQLPQEEAALRHQRCRRELARLCPEASGLLVFSRSAVYYLSGSMGNGMLWLPLEGEAVLLVRKGEQRCRLESPLTHIHTFKSYTEIPDICAACHSPLGEVAAAEKSALPWSLAALLQSRIKATCFVAGDAVLDRAQAVKSPWELRKLEEAGRLHAQALHELLPPLLRPGCSERALAHTLWEVFFALGHGGMLRMGKAEEEIFLGRVAVGDNANYPVSFGGAVGHVGEHPAIPFMGYAGSVWQKGQPLLLDTGFLWEGYHSKMCTTFFAGSFAEIPDALRRAHTCCADIMRVCSALLKPGQSVAALWEHAQTLAAQAGFGENFRGLGQGVGLALEQWPWLTPDEESLLEEHTVLTLAPSIAVPGLGMAALGEGFVVTAEGGRCLSGLQLGIHTVEC